MGQDMLRVSLLPPTATQPMPTVLFSVALMRLWEERRRCFQLRRERWLFCTVIKGPGQNTSGGRRVSSLGGLSWDEIATKILDPGRVQIWAAASWPPTGPSPHRWLLTFFTSAPSFSLGAHGSLDLHPVFLLFPFGITFIYLSLRF